MPNAFGDVTSHADARGGPLAGLALMALFTLWSGGLGIGFAAVVVVSSAELGLARVVVFIILSVLLVVASGRTAFELVRRLGSRA